MYFIFGACYMINNNRYLLFVLYFFNYFAVLFAPDGAGRDTSALPQAGSASSQNRPDAPQDRPQTPFEQELEKIDAPIIEFLRAANEMSCSIHQFSTSDDNYLELDYKKNLIIKDLQPYVLSILSTWGRILEKERKGNAAIIRSKVGSDMLGQSFDMGSWEDKVDFAVEMSSMFCSKVLAHTLSGVNLLVVYELVKNLLEKIASCNAWFNNRGEREIRALLQNRQGGIPKLEAFRSKLTILMKHAQSLKKQTPFFIPMRYKFIAASIGSFVAYCALSVAAMAVVSDTFSTSIAYTKAVRLLSFFPKEPYEVVFSKSEEVLAKRIIGCMKHNLSLPGGGLLFYGEPGNGKTLMVRYIAQQTNAALLCIRPSDVCAQQPSGSGGNQINSSGATALRAAFNVARYYKMVTRNPLIIFIDEIDFAGQKRTTVSDLTMKALIAELLLQVQETTKVPGIYLMAATNYYDYLNKALKRDGRFGQHVCLQNPDLETITKMIALNTDGDVNAAPLQRSAKFALGLPKSGVIDALREAATDCFLSGEIEIPKQSSFMERSLGYLNIKSYFGRHKEPAEENMGILIKAAAKQAPQAFWDNLTRSFENKQAELKDLKKTESQEFDLVKKMVSMLNPAL